MELERVKGNTWVLKSWELIPLYQVDDTRCILLDTGTVDQPGGTGGRPGPGGADAGGHSGQPCPHRPHGVLWIFSKNPGGRPGSDPRGGGTALFPLGLQLQYYNLSLGAFGQYPELESAPCLLDRIILPPGAGGSPCAG